MKLQLDDYEFEKVPIMTNIPTDVLKQAGKMFFASLERWKKAPLPF